MESNDIKLTRKQVEAIEVLKSGALHILLYGGTRSGKTYILVMAIIYRACRYPGSRHLIARYRRAHAQTSVWHETLLPLLKQCSEVSYTVNHSEMLVQFANGSEIWVGGMDDKERTEKILGHEYATVYFNEVSQIGWTAIEIGTSKLAQKIEGLQCRAYYDCNPPSPMHWSHKMFIEKVDPRTGEKLARPELYESLKLNPADNADNLADNYIENFLDTLPDRARRRWRDGEWIKPEGMILYAFSEDMILPARMIPRKRDMSEYTVGLDFGLNMAAGLIGWQGDTVWLVDDHGGVGLTTSQFNLQIQSRWHRHYNIAYCDPSGGERINEVVCGMKADNDVEAGLDMMLNKMVRREFWVSERCHGFLREVWDYRRDEVGRIVKKDDHYIDADRYGIFSHASGGIIFYAG